MSEKDFWIKIKESSDELLEEDPDAFLIMCQIMFRCRKPRSKYSKNKLKPGQAYIGDYESLKLSERRYRDAKERIEKEYQLATFKGTNKGTIATLTNSEFCDINLKEKDEQKDEPGTSQGRTKDEPGTTNKEQEDAYASLEEQQQDKESVDVSPKKLAKKKEIHTISGKIVAIYDGWHFEEMPCQTPVEALKNSSNQTYIIRRAGELSIHYLEMLTSIKAQLSSWGFNSNDVNNLKKVASVEKIQKGIAYFQIVEFTKTPQCGMFFYVRFPGVLIPEDSIPFKEQVLQEFKHLSTYNDAQCFIENGKIAFQRGLINRYIDLNSKQLKKELYEILDLFNIHNPFEKDELEKTLQEQLA